MAPLIFWETIFLPKTAIEPGISCMPGKRENHYIIQNNVAGQLKISLEVSCVNPCSLLPSVGILEYDMKRLGSFAQILSSSGLRYHETSINKELIKILMKVKI